MLRLNLIVWNCCVAVVVLSASSAGAFNPAIFDATTASPASQPKDNDRRIAVLDNDYLDRRFGRDRASEANKNEDEKSPAAQDIVVTRKDPVPRVNPASPVSPNRSLLTAINRTTPARRAAALRLAEAGRTSLQNGRKRMAIYYLERALGVEASPFIHYYLAQAHYQLADYQGARRFLEVAETGFSGWPEWVSELAALRGLLSSFPLTEQPTLKHNIAWTFNE